MYRAKESGGMDGSTSYRCHAIQRFPEPTDLSFRPNGLKARRTLEASLHKANATLSDITEQGNIDWVGNLNMICAVYSENELHLSQTGNCKTLLIRNGQII